MKTSLSTSSQQKEVCLICNGQGFVVLDVPVGHPNFGRALPCQCRQAEITLRKQVELTRVSNLNQLRHMTFETFLPDGTSPNESQRRSLRLAYNKAREFAAYPEGWLMLTGTYGCGKTHLAAAIAHEALRRGQSVLFVVTPDLLDHLRAAFGPASETSFDERFETIRQASLLILDDFGAQSATPWAKEKLFQLLNYRYTAQLPTVITTNLRMSDIEPRLRSRLGDPGITTLVTISSPDFRGSGGDKYIWELNRLSLYSDKSFDNFNLRQGELNRDHLTSLINVKNATQAYAEQPHGWLVIVGNNGCGKTHLAAAIANHRKNHFNEAPIFMVVPDLLDYLRAAFNPTSTAPLDVRFEEIRRTPVLILDDLGMESATPWAKEKLFQLLDYRYVAKLPTIFTTSIPVKPDPNSARSSRSDAKHDQRTIEDVHPWLANRMLDTEKSIILSILAGSYRASQTQRSTTAKSSEDTWVQKYATDDRWG